MVGPVMDRFGPASLFFVLAIYFAAYGAYACWRIAQRNAADGLVGKTDFLANTVPTPGTEAVNAMNQAINGDIGTR